MANITAVLDAILATLREMGQESTRDGRPYGLRDYASYYRELHPGAFRKSACEEPLTAGIAAGLLCRGHHAETERPYPRGGRCDLIVALDDLGSLWIECKTAYREHLARSKADANYDYQYNGDGCFDPGRGPNSWVGGASDIGAKDIPNLLTLTPDDADFIGVLLLGFDRECVPLTDQDLYGLLPACLTDWTPAHGDAAGRTWPDSYPIRASRGFRERVWFWYRPVSQAG